MSTDRPEPAAPKTAYEIAVAQAIDAGRCEQCVTYGVRPGLLCGTCGDGLTPFTSGAAPVPPADRHAATAER